MINNIWSLMGNLVCSMYRVHTVNGILFDVSFVERLKCRSHHYIMILLLTALCVHIKNCLHELIFWLRYEIETFLGVRFVNYANWKSAQLLNFVGKVALCLILVRCQCWNLFAFKSMRRKNIMDCLWLNSERIFAIWNNNLFISRALSLPPEIYIWFCF